MSGKKITLRAVEKYIGSGRGLRKDLQEDFRSNCMLAEADLQAYTFRHLRNFLKPEKTWRIFANAFAKTLRRFPDPTVLDGDKRRIAIELKWRRDSISGKDRRVLNQFLDTPHARKAYFITTVKNKSDYQKLGSKKRSREKYRLKEIAVPLALLGSRLTDRMLSGDPSEPR
jgi:hypothetical protein